MSKYSKDLDETLVQKVRSISKSAGLDAFGINVEAIRLKKSKNSVGKVLVGNDLVKLFTGDDLLVAVALYEDLLLQFDDATQNMLIESLISQIGYDDEKDKVVITKPELSIGIGMYHKYGNIAVQKAELVYLTCQQMKEKEKEEKEAKKNNKKHID